MPLSLEISAAWAAAIGKQCCRQRVGRSKSLSIGFGAQVSHSIVDSQDSFYGEWEIGSYYSSWRIAKDGRILLGSTEGVDSVEALDAKLQQIRLGMLSEIEQTGSHDIRIALDNGVLVEFLCSFSGADEFFHIFGPNNVYVECRFPDVWTLRSSDEPMS
jgi:hypothetical protein